MHVEMKEHKLTGKVGEITYLLQGPSIEENQQFIDEHITSAQMMQASAYCKGALKRDTKLLETKL
jgi:hypothetical protein